MVRVIKRDCSEVDFDKNKISTAILKAMKNGSGIVKPKIAESIADEIEEECKDREEIDISEIEAMVFDKLIMSDGTLWEGQIALYFRWTCLPDCAVPELDADYRRNNRRLS